MKIAITGGGTLANAVNGSCKDHFQVVVLREAELVWVCGDTPIEASSGLPRVDDVLRDVRVALLKVPAAALVLVSSQVPIGTTRRLEQEYPTRRFAYSPENIRVKTAVADFQQQARVIVGRRHSQDDELLRELFAPFTKTLIFTDPETAEMCKHALNAYLGLSIAFINEIARLAEPLGVDMATLESALLTERRISPAAPLHAGAPFGGGHLLRDIATLTLAGEKLGQAIPLIDAIRVSNDAHQAVTA